MAAFDFRDRLDLVSTGPLTAAVATAAFPDADAPLVIVGQIQNYNSVVAEPLALNGKAFRHLFPANSYGETSWIGIPKNGPGVAGNIEYKIRFNAPWQWGNDPTQQHLGGKCGMALDLTDVNYGNSVRVWWYGSGSHYLNPGFIPIFQHNKSPSQELMPVVYSAPLVVGQVYKVRLQAFGGPNGFAKVWLDDVLLGSCSGDYSDTTTAAGNHWYKFSAFAGGASSIYAPTIDQWTDVFDVHIWSDPPQMAIAQAAITLS